MKSLFGLIIGGGVISVLLFAALVSNLSAQQTVTIQGTVFGLNWNDDGDVIAVAIRADGVEYTVSNSGKGKELLGQVGEIVKATGTVKRDDKGDKTITVTSFEVIVDSSQRGEDTTIIEEE